MKFVLICFDLQTVQLW